MIALVRRSLLLVGVACSIGLAACSAGSGTLGAAPRGASSALDAGPAVRTPAFGGATAKSTNFGVGLAGDASAMSDKGSYTHTYCQSKGTGNCPVTRKGLRSAQFSDAKTLHGRDGTFHISQSAASALGLSTYGDDANASSTDGTGSVEGARGEEWLNWSDTLHVTSKSLPKGSPVTISVVLTVSPSVTNVGCDPSNLAQGQLTFTASGQDSLGGSALSVVGGCSNGTFIYLFGPGSGASGTSDSGVIDTSVGSAVNITGFGHVVNVVCDSFGGTCVGSFPSHLTGTATWQITGITSGAAYRTDSGDSYH